MSENKGNVMRTLHIITPIAINQTCVLVLAVNPIIHILILIEASLSSADCFYFQAVMSSKSSPDYIQSIMTESHTMENYSVMIGRT